MDKLLKAKWDGMKTALASQNITTALNYFNEKAKPLYNDIFTALNDQLPQLVQDMQEIQLIYLSNNVSKYRINKYEMAGGQMMTITYYIYFSKDNNGIWKIYQF